MTKLLEFNPADNYNSVTKLLDEDIWFSCTPDMPTLRYAKQIPVFIWDEFKTSKSMSKTFGITPDHFRTYSYLCHTEDSFLPFINECASTDSDGLKYKYMLPESPNWSKGIKDFKMVSDMVPRQVLGRIELVSLYTLRLLDLYYHNMSLHYRTMKTIKMIRQDKTEIMDAWVYTLPSTAFTKYRPHEGDYKILPGFKPKACMIQDKYGDNNMGCYSSSYVTTVK